MERNKFLWSLMTKHLVIPDVQVKPGHSTEFLTAIGNYIVAKQPDTVVCIGDFADMPSLSSYDVGTKSFEGRRYHLDVEATKQAMTALMDPIEQFNERARKNHKERYNPRLVLTLGNHEQRIIRATEKDPKLDGLLSIDDLGYRAFGWEVYPYLDVVVIDGVAYSHFFTSGVLGRPATSAQAQLSKKHMSCIAGHQQGLQIATGHRADGSRLTSVIAGSCYEHDEDYMGPQGNKHWRGILVLHEVVDGQFDLMPVSLKYLKERYA
jgi:hypothetical protein